MQKKDYLNLAPKENKEVEKPKEEKVNNVINNTKKNKNKLKVKNKKHEEKERRRKELKEGSK